MTDSLSSWLARRQVLQRRRCSSKRFAAIEAHVHALTVATVRECTGAETLRAVRAEPAGSARDIALSLPQTPLIVEIDNQLARLGRPRRNRTEAPMHKSIPLNKLVIADCNVRKTLDAATIAELAEDIAAHGLLHNLTVRPRGKGVFEVITGGRRLRALQKLAGEERLAADFPVPCSVKELDDPGAQELSVAENVAREALNPIDEFDALAALASAGVAAPDIARRFGVDVRRVQQRMKLGQLAEPIREALRAGEITVSVAAAFTIGTFEQQVNAWTELSSRWVAGHITAWSVRSLLNKHLTRAGDRLCRFVGVDAYLAAGGPITDDLFEDERYIEDRALLERIAGEKLEAVADGYRQQGWKWVETSINEQLFQTRIVGQEQPIEVPLPDALAQELEEIEAQVDVLETASDAEDEERYQQLCARMDALYAMRQTFTPDMKAGSGVFLCVDDLGIVSSTPGLIRAEDRHRPPQGDVDTDDEDGIDPDDQTDSSDEEAPRAEPEEPPLRLSQALLDDLAAWRTQVLQVAIAEHPDIAYDLLVFHLVTRGSGLVAMYRPSCLDLAPHPTNPKSSLDDTPTAMQAMVHCKDSLNWTWLDDDGAVGPDAFTCFCTIARDDKDRLMAWAVALISPSWMSRRRARSACFSRIR